MKTRCEVVEYMKSRPNAYDLKRPPETCWHFGLVDMREILDFIYGGPPESEDEKLTRLHRPYGT